MERTAYPRFTRAISVRELHEAFTPSSDEIDWARGKARSPNHLLALVVLLKSYHRLGYFPDLFEVPLGVVDHIRGVLELTSDVEPVYECERTLWRHREFVRTRLGVVYDPAAAARALAEAAIRAAAVRKDNPADLINVALEELVRARLELPGYSTLDAVAAAIRTEVNTAVFTGIDTRMSDTDAADIAAMLRVDAE